MAMQAGNSVGPSSHVVGSAFAQQYYRILNGSPEHAHKFYYDESILGRPDSDGTMTFVTTTHDINEQILSTDLRGSLIELENVDTQPSHKGGMLILVTGSLTMPDTVKRRFTQSFFLAPQENGGYFVLNDMLRYIPEMPSAETNEALANHVNGSTQIAPFPAESETTSVKESTDPELPSAEIVSVNGEVINPSAETISVNAEVINPSAENISVKEKAINPSAENMSVKEKAINPSAENISVKEKVINPSAENFFVKEKVINPSANDSSQIVNEVGVETCVKLVDVDADKIPEAAPAPPASAQKDVVKKSYASIVKVMKQSTPPPPIAKLKPKPNPMVKRAENVEKSAFIPAKPTCAADTAPPNDKTVSNEQGYSVFVKNLPYNASVEMVEGEFRKFGAIKPGGIQVRNRQPDRFCFGFVEFESQQSMHAAIEASPIRFGSKLSEVEEKRTRTRVVNGVMTRGDNNGNVREPGKGGYHGDNFRGQGAGFMNSGIYHDGDNFRGHGAGYGNNNNYRDGDNFRGHGAGFGNNNNNRGGDNFRAKAAGFGNSNNYRDGNNFRGRGTGFVDNGNYRDGDNMRNEFRNRDEYSSRGRGPQGNGYHENGNGYHQNGNRNHQLGPLPNGNVNGNGRSARPKQPPVTT